MYIIYKIDYQNGFSKNVPTSKEVRLSITGATFMSTVLLRDHAISSLGHYRYPESDSVNNGLSVVNLL